MTTVDAIHFYCYKFKQYHVETIKLAVIRATVQLEHAKQYGPYVMATYKAELAELLVCISSLDNVRNLDHCFTVSTMHVFGQIHDYTNSWYTNGIFLYRTGQF